MPLHRYPIARLPACLQSKWVLLASSSVQDIAPFGKRYFPAGLNPQRPGVKQKQRRKKRAFIHGLPELLLVDGTPRVELSGMQSPRLPLDREAHLTHSPHPPKPPPRAHPRHRGGRGWNSPGLGARPSSTPHQEVLAFLPICALFPVAPTRVPGTTASLKLFRWQYSNLPQQMSFFPSGTLFSRQAPWHLKEEDLTLLLQPAVAPVGLLSARVLHDWLKPWVGSEFSKWRAPSLSLSLPVSLSLSLSLSPLRFGFVSCRPACPHRCFCPPKIHEHFY